MSVQGDAVRPALERMDPDPPVRISEAEYRRLLGYPRDHVPGERARELEAWAEAAFAEWARPWIYWREVELRIGERDLLLEGVAFDSRELHEHLLRSGARRAVVVAASAGRGCEAHALQLWEQGRPDEYFFLETYGSAVVEHLVAVTSGQICDLAESRGLMAVPHYSPGYSGWNVADQNKLFDLVARGRTGLFPEALEVLPSGMLRPKKSQLAVVGLAPRTGDAPESVRPVPCGNCSFSPCRYRRSPYRHAAVAAKAAPGYTVNAKALGKWARERVSLAPGRDGTLVATFRFEGTTCSNMGRPLAFDYGVTLGPADEGYPILRSGCRPAPGDEGHTFMCAYLNDPAVLMGAIASEKPLIGRPLDEVLQWPRSATSTGCHCDAESRSHKWGLALEAIHFALAQSRPRLMPQ